MERQSWKYGGREAYCQTCGNFCWHTFCWTCSAAEARSEYDGSSSCFNWFCLPTYLIRNIVRLGYGISGSTCGDVCYSYLCPCCSAAQLRSEVEDRKQLGIVMDV